MEYSEQLGAKNSGPIFEKLNSIGINHESYVAMPEKLPNETKLGQGAENVVYQDPINSNKVQKHPRLTNSTTHTFNKGIPLRIKTTHLDKLIYQYEKILNIRIFNCVVNKAHSQYLYYNPDKISEVPYLESTNASIDKNAVIHEDKLSTDNPVKYVSREVARFVPDLIKDIFFYFDTIGLGQAFKTGVNKKNQPVYHVVDGIIIMNKNTENLYEKHKHKLPRDHDISKESKKIEKFQKLVQKCSKEQLEILLKEIEQTFNQQSD